MDKVIVGTLINTFGIKGEVKIASSTDFPDERFKKGATLFIQYHNDEIEMEIATHRIHKGYDLISFKGYGNINDVEKYKGCLCLAYKDENLLDEGEYYISDIIGCDVYNYDEYLGKVIDILDHTYQELYVVKTDKKNIMIPNVDAFIKKKDVENHRIEVELIKGFIDED